jgi:hypothetical protein
MALHPGICLVMCPMAKNREDDRGFLTRPNRRGMKFLGLDIPIEHFWALRRAADAAGQSTVSAIVRQILQAWYQVQPDKGVPPEERSLHADPRKLGPPQFAQPSETAAAADQATHSPSRAIGLSEHASLEGFQAPIPPTPRSIMPAHPETRAVSDPSTDKTEAEDE